MKIQCECGRMFSEPKLNKSGLCRVCYEKKRNRKVYQKAYQKAYKKKREKSETFKY
ncbi:MAG: hypothetical protein QQN41_11345 [Nitrosopumilus sp.]